MPIFSRRRLQAMLNDLAPILDPSKAQELVSRLESTDTKNALGAEMELAVTWAFSKEHEIEVEPGDFGGRNRLDLVCPNMFSNGPCVIEVTAVSDDGFSDRSSMRRVAEKLKHEANRTKRRAGNHLCFEFGEQSGYKNGRFFRRRRVTSSYEPSESVLNELSSWVSQEWPPKTPLHLVDEHIDVTATYHETVHPESQVISRMPTVVYDPKKNPVFSALANKKRQMRTLQDGVIRCIILADAGCRMLRNKSTVDHAHGELSRREVVFDFLDGQRSGKQIDIVCVLSPRRFGGVFGHPYREELKWELEVYTHQNDLADEAGANFATLAKLPTPTFEGYQARSLHRQGSFSPTSNSWYLGACMTQSDEKLEVRMSARLLQDYLSGRVDKKQYEFELMGEELNPFERALEMGYTISNVVFDCGGIDEDDDHVVVSFKLDPAAGDLTTPDPPE